MSNEPVLPTFEQLRELKEQMKKNPQSWGANRPLNSFPANNGKKCRSCIHKVKMSYSKSFYKCELNKKHWTHSTKTDIRLRDEACNLWEKE